jgi:DNA-binding HxlR family transcriptional regulator
MAVVHFFVLNSRKRVKRVSRICKDGFDIECIKGQREVYGIAYTQNILSGRWKYLILWYLKSKKRRYSEIKAFLGDISQGSLTKQLRELETDGLINRKVYPEVPPRVEYSLSSKGQEFIPIVDLMEEFGKKFGVQID